MAKIMLKYMHALRAWYINQSSELKCKRVNRLDKKINRQIDGISDAVNREPWRILYLKATNHATQVKPAR